MPFEDVRRIGFLLNDNPLVGQVYYGLLTDKESKPEALDKRRLVLFLLALPLYFGLFMFLPAGTWAWTKGWLFIGVFLGTLVVVAFYLWRVNPEVVAARSSSH